MTNAFFLPIFLGGMGFWEWVIVLIVVLLLFGVRKGVKGEDEDKN